MSAQVAQPWTVIPHPNGALRFLLFDSPNDTNMETYINKLHSENVQNVVCVCDLSYGTERFEQENIKIHAWPFLDGTTPSVDVIRNWLNLITKVVSEAADKTVIPAIGIHCIAGLGRAPLLIAVALIEDGIAPLEAVKIIRERRPGSFNTTQLRYLKAYTPTKNRQQQCCVIS